MAAAMGIRKFIAYLRSIIIPVGTVIQIVHAKRQL